MQKISTYFVLYYFIEHVFKYRYGGEIEMNLINLFIVKYKLRFYRKMMKLSKKVDLDIARRIYSHCDKNYLLLTLKVIDNGLF